MEVERAKKESPGGPEGILGPKWSASEANLAPKTEPKSRFLDVQEGTYLKIAENVKIVATPIRKHDF